MTIDEIRAKLKIALDEKRFNHSLGVVQSAVELARHYGADVGKAALAALLHDCAKNYSHEEMFELCERFGVELDETTKASPGLIHGFLGAVIADKYYGVSDGEIYDAIYYHTVGKPNMSLLTKIIYIADGIEPGRTYEGVEQIRELAFRDIDQALVLQIDYTIQSVISRGGLLHTNTIETRNYYLRQKQIKVD